MEQTNQSLGLENLNTSQGTFRYNTFKFRNIGYNM